MRKATVSLLAAGLIVGLCHPVANDRRGPLKRGQIIAPSIRTAELIVHDRAWRVDMRFPSPPL